MKNRSPQVDTYVARAPEFAREILVRIREAFHAGCPELEERIKWGMPSFEYKGLLGGMAAFKKHVAFGFWKSRLMESFEATFGSEPGASAMRARVLSLADLPPRKVLVSFVRQAKRLNDEKVPEPKLAKPRRGRRVAVPADLRQALARSTKARATFEGLPPSHRREYTEWITEAKRSETRARRVATTVEWLTQGKTRKWKYERPARSQAAKPARRQAAKPVPRQAAKPARRRRPAATA